MNFLKRGVPQPTKPTSPEPLTIDRPMTTAESQKPEPQPTPSIPSEGEGDGSSGLKDTPPDFKTLLNNEGGAERAAEQEAVESESIGKDVFYQTFKGAVAAPNAVAVAIGAMGRPVAPFPLESLPVRPEEEGQARAASDALYDICGEVHWLRFLIKADDPWLMRVLAIGGFAVPKALAVAAEVRSKRKPVPEAPQESQEDPVTEDAA